MRLPFLSTVSRRVSSSTLPFPRPEATFSAPTFSQSAAPRPSFSLVHSLASRTISTGAPTGLLASRLGWVRFHEHGTCNNTSNVLGFGNYTGFGLSGNAPTLTQLRFRRERGGRIKVKQRKIDRRTRRRAKERVEETTKKAKVAAGVYNKVPATPDVRKFVLGGPPTL